VLACQHHLDVIDDTCSQFHRHFTYKFFVRTSFWQLFYIHITREKLLKRRSYEKFSRKILMKLTLDHSIADTFLTPRDGCMSTKGGKSDKKLNIPKMFL